MSKIQIPSVVALILGFVLLVSADRLAGPRDANGGQSDRQWVIRTAASTNGVLIFLIAAAELLHSSRKRPLVGAYATLWAVVGLVGTFVLLNAIGYVWYLVARPSDQSLDTLLFYLSLIASPVAGVVGGIIGARRASRILKSAGDCPGR